MATAAARTRFLISRATWTHQVPKLSSNTGSLKSSSLLSLHHDGWKRWFASYPTHQVVGMPALSPTMEAGTIASWKVKEGEVYRAGDVLCEVETDKATVSFEAQEDGVLAKILQPGGQGTEIKIGQPIMVTVDNVSDVSAFQSFVLGETGSSTPGKEETSAPASTPPASPSVTSSHVQKPVSASTPTSHVSSESSTHSVGRVIASPLAWTVAKERGINLTSTPIHGSGPGGRIIAADVREYVPPIVQAVAESASVSASTTKTVPVVPPVPLATTSAAASKVSVPIPTPSFTPPSRGTGYTDYPLSPSAQIIAAQLVASKQTVPHYYLTVDVCLDKLVELRSSLNKSLGKDASDSITLNDLLIKAAAASMKACPMANASWMGSAVRVYDSVDINVVLGNGNALYAPVIRNVGGRGLKSISEDIASALRHVQEGTVELAESFDAVGTVTVMNLGMYGIKSCAPIIRQPQAVALALGAAENRIVPNNDSDEKEEKRIYKTSVMLTATLSCDHRVVDGAVGAQWLSAFKTTVENPMTLLL